MLLSPLTKSQPLVVHKTCQTCIKTIKKMIGMLIKNCKIKLSRFGLSSLSKLAWSMYFDTQFEKKEQ